MRRVNRRDKRPRDRHRPRCHYHRDGTAKADYPAETDALAFIRKHGLDGYTAYECRTCHKWHIGHS